ncbi:hypothetical protein EJB05_25054, partial [Eragrostis curvula]
MWVPASVAFCIVFAVTPPFGYPTTRTVVVAGGSSGGGLVVEGGAGEDGLAVGGGTFGLAVGGGADEDGLAVGLAPTRTSRMCQMRRMRSSEAVQGGRKRHHRAPAGWRARAGRAIVVVLPLLCSPLGFVASFPCQHFADFVQHVLLGGVPFPSDILRLKELGVCGVAHGIENLVLPTRDYLYAPLIKDLCKAADFIHSKNLLK